MSCLARHARHALFRRDKEVFRMSSLILIIIISQQGERIYSISKIMNIAVLLALVRLRQIDTSSNRQRLCSAVACLVIAANVAQRI